MKNQTEFTQPVSMQVTEEQYKDLAPKLEEMGYDVLTFDEYSSVIVTNFGDNYYTVGLGHSHEYNRHFIDHYNPELFLALAAMTEGETWNTGEWLIDRVSGEWYNTKGTNSSNGFMPGHNYSYGWRKATVSELIAKFPNPAENKPEQTEEFKEGDEVVADGTPHRRYGMLLPEYSQKYKEGKRHLTFSQSGGLHFCREVTRPTPKSTYTLDQAKAIIAEAKGIKVEDITITQ